jgi:CelD/BcsL family acetyltransferase involved in cellulose biosynthesis
MNGKRVEHVKVQSAPHAGMLEVVVADAEDFAALQGEWEELYGNSSLATPLQSWAWLRSWWEFYGEGYELRLVTKREGSLLVGLVPVMLERRAGVGRLLFLGTGLTDHLDVLVREGWEDKASEAAVRALGEMKSWWWLTFSSCVPRLPRGISSGGGMGCKLARGRMASPWRTRSPGMSSLCP